MAENKGFFRRLVEDRLKIRVRPSNTNELTSVSPEYDDITVKQLNSDNISNSSLFDISILQDFCTISNNRNNKYTGFEEMLEDPIIAAAIEMYVDDATAYNELGDIIWAEGTNELAVQAANRLITMLDLNRKAWQHIYSLCVYGDLYLRLYREGDESDFSSMYNDNNNYAQLTIKPGDKQRKLEEYVEFVNNPACLFDLQNKDKTTGFIRIADTTQIDTTSLFHTQPLQTVKISNTIMYDRLSFIHISLSESVSRTPELLRVEDDEKETSTVYKIKSGKSVLEDAYPVNQTLKLLEDSLVLNRLTRSAIVRLLQIEVGDLPKQEVTNLLHRFKNNLEQKMAVDTRTQTAKSFNSPGPADNIVYTVTKEGKGAINVQTLGGDVNVKDIMDLDYFNNKKLAALKIPKQFLNFDSPEGIGGNGVSLTKISSRYAHTIKRIQNAYIQGITDLINYFFMDKDQPGFVNDFTIKMVSPSTVEESERSETLSNNINQTRDIMDLVSELPDKDKYNILAGLFSEKLNLSDIASIISDYADTLSENVNEDDFGGSGGDYGRGGPSDYNDFGGDDMNFEFTDSEPNFEPELNTEPETNIEPEASPEVEA